MMDLGRVCVKIAGRDAGRQCVIIDTLEDNYVMIDGQTRRKKCNIVHLEPLDKILKIKTKASHDEVAKIFKTELKIVLKEKKKKDKSKSAKPVKKRKVKVKEEPEKKK